MQQRENQMLEKLAEARTRQARAMERFALATARVLQAEKQIQAIRERFQSAPDMAGSSEAAPDASPQAHQNPAGGDELIAAILAITQTELASHPSEASETEQQVRDTTGEEDTPPQAPREQDADADATDTTARLPTMRQQGPHETP